MTVPTATAAQIRALHSYVVDAILGQDPEVTRDLLHLFGGLHSLNLTDALEQTGFARVRSVIEHDQLVYLVEVHGDDGWLVLTRPPATALGIPDTPEVREQEIRFHAERMLRELTGEDQ